MVHEVTSFEDAKSIFVHFSLTVNTSVRLTCAARVTQVLDTSIIHIKAFNAWVCMSSIVVYSKCNCDLITKTRFFTKAMLGCPVNACPVFKYRIRPRANSIRRTLLAEFLIMRNKSNTITGYISCVTKSAFNGIALNSLMMFGPANK